MAIAFFVMINVLLKIPNPKFHTLHLKPETSAPTPEISNEAMALSPLSLQVWDSGNWENSNREIGSAFAEATWQSHSSS
jgi:hypothetical protein